MYVTYVYIYIQVYIYIYTYIYMYCQNEGALHYGNLPGVPEYLLTDYQASGAANSAVNVMLKAPPDEAQLPKPTQQKESADLGKPVAESYRLL